MFWFFCQTKGAPALTKNQALNQVKKVMTPSKKAPITKKTPPSKPIPAKKPTPVKKTTPTKVTVVTNLNELNKALEKFYAEQKKLRASDRSQALNQYVNIQDRCPCTTATCQCPELPKLVTI